MWKYRHTYIENSLTFYNHLTKLFPDIFFYIVGETSYSPCCADDIAALHLKSDLIIRIGESCLSKNKQLPVFYLYETLHFDEESVLNKISSYLPENNILVNLINFSFSTIRSLHSSAKALKTLLFPLFHMRRINIMRILNCYIVIL
jgi:diphthamide biosynthesis enzyme Dph1/Dph2-like protein